MFYKHLLLSRPSIYLPTKLKANQIIFFKEKITNLQIVDACALSKNLHC